VWPKVSFSPFATFKLVVCLIRRKVHRLYKRKKFATCQCSSTTQNVPRNLERKFEETDKTWKVHMNERLSLSFF